MTRQNTISLVHVFCASAPAGVLCCSAGIAVHVQVCGDETDIFADPVVVRDWIGQSIGG
ncbi:hypothetical protein [Saccharopolyspora hattusasensis]|uniref:hypothetical protein n=1 Tax=Saccharopolyspora hattusasensis TaxID=1128679 RepID=UPI003D97E239